MLHSIFNCCCWKELYLYALNFSKLNYHFSGKMESKLRNSCIVVSDKNEHIVSFTRLKTLLVDVVQHNFIKWSYISTLCARFIIIITAFEKGGNVYTYLYKQ